MYRGIAPCCSNTTCVSFLQPLQTLVLIVLVPGHCLAFTFFNVLLLFLLHIFMFCYKTIAPNSSDFKPHIAAPIKMHCPPWTYSPSMWDHSNVVATLTYIPSGIGLEKKAKISVYNFCNVPFRPTQSHGEHLFACSLSPPPPTMASHS